MPHRPLHPRRRAAGFTLIELILVMVILAIISAVVVPTLWAFAEGRRAGDAAATIVAMANYARAQAAAEGTIYRINFDPRSDQVWLTEQKEGVFVAPTSSDYATPVTLPAGVRMDVQVTPATVAVPIARPDVVQSTDVTPPPFGQPPGTPNTLVSVAHDGTGSYVEVQPGGRTDPCLIHITDSQGSVVNVGCATATDTMHVLKPGEM